MASQDKSELLKQLKINKNQIPSAGISIPVFIGCCLFSALLCGALVYWLAAPGADTKPAGANNMQSSAAPQAPAKTPSPSANNPSTSQAPRLDRSREILNASGYITARRIATVSSETLGLLASVDVEEGMVVEQGQVLARLDDSIAKVNYELSLAQVEVLKARLASIRTDLAEAERVFSRIERLGTDNFSSEAERTRTQSDVEKLLSSEASAEADIRVAQLEVNRQRELLEKHVIRAPFPGIVTMKNAQPGEIVSPSSAGGGFTRTGICTVVDMDSLEIEVDVNEAFIGRVHPEQKVVANLDAYPNWDIAARVIAIIPTADRAKATVRVRIGIVDKDPRILPDMGVKVAFIGNNE